VTSDAYRTIGSHRDSGQAALLLFAVLAALLVGALILFVPGQAHGARARHQRAADLAAVSAAQVVRRNYSRLFEPAFLEPGVANPRHLANTRYLALARAGALRGAWRNGVPPGQVRVSFPGTRFGPTRVTVALRGETRISAPDRRRHLAGIEVSTRAAAGLTPDISGLGLPRDGQRRRLRRPARLPPGQPTCRFPRLTTRTGMAGRLTIRREWWRCCATRTRSGGVRCGWSSGQA
jgi:hypothetical protein